MPKKSVKSGEVVFVKSEDKSAPDALEIKETSLSTEPIEAVVQPSTEPLETIAPTTLQKQRVKREPTDAQKAHWARLKEVNQKRREEAKAKLPPPVEIPEPAGDVKRMAVRPKRDYKKKDKDFWEAITTKPEKKAEIESLPKNEIVYPPVVELKKERRPRVSRVSTPSPSPPVPPPVAKRNVKAKELKEPLRLSKSNGRKKVRYISDSESESDDESDDDSSDDEVVERIAQKTHKRISTLEKIDQRLRTLRNPYESYGLSVF